MFEDKEIRLESALKSIAHIIYSQLYVDSFVDLDVSIKIVEKRNRKQYFSINKKMKNLTMLLYLTGVMHSNIEKAIEINKALDEVYYLLESINSPR